MMGFRENGLLLDAPPDWEEFMWKNKPFGFHVRRNSNKDSRSENDEIQELQRYIKEFMN